MHPSLLLSLPIIFGLLAASAIFYSVLCLLGGRKFMRTRANRCGGDAMGANASPGFSILKPLRGTDEGMETAFRSHCLQNYAGEYELIFGVSRLDDPAAAYVERLGLEFPQRSIRLVHCPGRMGINGKVSNLIQMLPYARHSHIIVNDSDILVPPDYLACVAAGFENPARPARQTHGGRKPEPVGMVTCLYRGRASRNLWSKLEAFGVSAEFMPACLAATWVEGGAHYGLGATLAFTREALDAIGGFTAVADHLADDYQLSAEVIRSGRRVELASCIVETSMPDYVFGDFAAHQLRWLRAVKASRPGNYFGLMTTFGGLWCVLALVASGGSRWAWILFGVYAALRLAIVEMISRRVIQDSGARSGIWMLPLREALTPLFWAIALIGNSVIWRGERFRLRKGRLEAEK